MNAHSFEILQHEAVGTRYRRLRARSTEVAQRAQPGQYMHILPDASVSDPLLRRAFSVLRCGNDWFEMLYRVEGRGTQLLSQRKVGEFLDSLGPLGKPFALEKDTLLLVGGGIGVPPMVFIAERCRNNRQQNALVVSRETTRVKANNCRTEVFLGARSADDVVEEAALRAAADVVTVVTQDGSIGEMGLVTQPLERRLRELKAQHERGSEKRETVAVCACGPWPMLRAVAQLCAKYDVPCQVSMEENMPCGIGVCNGCVVPMLDAEDEYERYQRICVAGPVMDAAHIDWGTAAVTAGLEDGRAARDNA